MKIIEAGILKGGVYTPVYVSRPAHGSPADRGSADYYYWRAKRPHKMVGRDEVTDLTQEEIEQYNAAYDSETDRKDWG